MRVSWVYAAVVAAILGYFLFRIPIQVSDSFTNLLVLDRPWSVLVGETGIQPGYLRPGLWATLKFVHDASGGEYFSWYRGVHALQAAAVLALFVGLVRPTTAAAAAVLPLGLAVLVGSHTFAWTLREAFPINTFLTIVVLCLAAANLSFARYRPWQDVAAVILFVVAALTVESGLLVGVIVIGGVLVGVRGVSVRGAAVIGGLMLAYLALRFLVLDVGVPTLADRDAGFGFRRYDGPELAAMFGANPLGFYAYNVVASIAGVLAAEPRDGVWRLTGSVLDGEVHRVFALGAIASVLATALIVRFVWLRRRAWLAWELERDDRLVLLFLLVLGANAAISYAYTKDVIMSPAGVFYAAALFVASRHLVERLPSMGRISAGAALVVLTALSLTWGVRQVGIHAALVQTSAQVREQWAYIGDWLVAWGYDPAPPRVRTLSRQLQDDAVVHHPAKMALRDEWTVWFEVE
jgi:hypothetical protein